MLKPYWGGGTNSSLGTSVGLAPQSCINFTGSYLSNDKVFNFTWEDVGCDFWGGVRLVIKKGSIAETFNDGDIIIDTFEKNKYKEAPLSINIDSAGEYYCTLFPFSSTWVMNTVKFNTVKIIVSKPLNECTWEEIAAASASGNASLMYSLKDTKELVGTDGNTYTMDIINIDDLGICMCSKELIPKKYENYFVEDLKIETGKDLRFMNNSELRQVIVNLFTQIGTIIPDNISTFIKNIPTNILGSEETHNQFKIYLPTKTMMTNSSIFPDNNSRIKYKVNTSEACRYGIDLSTILYASYGVKCCNVFDDGSIKDGSTIFSEYGANYQSVYPVLSFYI